MFKKILIANRGEIACRVIKTARKMGIATVAVYSEADAEARHRGLADEAVAIGPAPVGESYLRGERIIAAARATGAEAIHPGYGFLSENAEFAQRVISAGLVWVGPNPASITAMGLKDAAKQLMQQAGVPVTPGYMGSNQDPGFLSDRIRFLGEIPWDQVVRTYQALDLFAAPARWEGFGLTPLEAMACGVPTVAARVGAYETLIRNGETGSLVPRDDADALTAALARWLDDDAGRETAGRAAREHVATNHAIEGEARAIVEVYRKLLA